MPALRPDPDLFDLDGWRQRLAELQAEPQDVWRDASIAATEAHIAAISEPPQNTAPEAP